MMDGEYNVKVSYIDMIDSQGIDEDGVPSFTTVTLISWFTPMAT